MQTRSRLFGGAAVGAICVLPFYQGLWTACAKAGLSLHLYPSGGLPLILVLCLIGALLGTGYALALPTLRMPGWCSGTVLGLLITLALWFVIAPLRGLPVAGGWHVVPMLQTMTIHIAWGISLGVTLPLLRGWVEARHPLRPNRQSN